MQENFPMQENDIRPCPICEYTVPVRLPKYSQGNWIIARCQHCSLVFLGNPPAYVALEAEYAWEKTSKNKKESNKRGSTIFSPMARLARNLIRPLRRNESFFRQLPETSAVLDIGCGAGHRLQPPTTPFGIELSTELHRLADERMRKAGGYCLQGAGAERIWDFPENFFDGILMHSYLEHEKDISGVLRGAQKALKPNGCIYVRVPNFGSINRRVIGRSWCGFRFPDHVNYFEKHTLKRLANSTGFYFTLKNFIRAPFDDNLIAILQKRI